MERAKPEDVAAITAIEARPDNRGKIGEWPAEKHLRLMDTPGFAYFVERVDGAVAAFAIVERLHDAGGVVYLRRIAAAVPGGGHGQRLLRAVLDWVFAQDGLRKLELRLREHNEGARRLYLALGFGEEGMLRGREDESGSRVMTILREEWVTWRVF